MALAIRRESIMIKSYMNNLPGPESSKHSASALGFLLESAFLATIKNLPGLLIIPRFAENKITSQILIAKHSYWRQLLNINYFPIFIDNSFSEHIAVLHEITNHGANTLMKFTNCYNFIEDIQDLRIASEYLEAHLHAIVAGRDIIGNSIEGYAGLFRGLVDLFYVLICSPAGNIEFELSIVETY